MFTQKYAISVELTAAREAVDAAQQRAQRHAEAVESAVAEIKAKEAEAQRLQGELASADSARALADDGEVGALDKAAAKLATSLDSATRELNRARAKLQALESHAGQIDDEVRNAGKALGLELSLWVGDKMDKLRADLQTAAAPLMEVMSVAKALQSAHSEALNDVVGACYIPDPAGFMRFSAEGGAWRNHGVNLLDAAKPDEQLSSLVAQIRRTAQGATTYAGYTPLAKRPVPYVRKGYTIG